MGRLCGWGYRTYYGDGWKLLQSAGKQGKVLLSSIGTIRIDGTPKTAKVMCKAEAELRRWAGCCRKVWNRALAAQQARHKRGEKHAGFVGMCQWITAWRKAAETAYLAQVPVHVLQNVVRALDGAFQRFFRKEGGYPKFKRRDDGSRSRCAP